jgi:6-pyruvoyltetrahydropterin/6-carboxytetrahydropterin synthase
MYIIRKKFQFSAAHRLSSPGLSDEENRRIYGKCTAPNFHGHNYTLEVAVSGEVDPRTGMVINFEDLKSIVQEEIVSQLDHKNLNLDVDFLKGEITTSENIARLIWQKLKPRFRDVRLVEISLAETGDNIAVYRGD